MATLCHLYNPEVRPNDQVMTWDCLMFSSWPHNLQVWHRRCTYELDMRNWLQFHWEDDGDLLTWEQDIVATPDHVRQLRQCPEPVCAWSYLLPHGVVWDEVPGGASLGLWKATSEARRAVTATPPVPRVPWRDLASALGERLPPVHVHYPCIVHNHSLVA